MKRKAFCCLALSQVSWSAVAQKPHAPESTLPLKTGWQLQSSAKVEGGGGVISTPKFNPKGWYEVEVFHADLWARPGLDILADTVASYLAHVN